MKRIAATLSVIIILSTASCSYKTSGVKYIRIKGSDTMLILVENLAREFMKMNPDISIYVEGGGTKLGIKALTSGDVNISTASRPLSTDEIKLLADRYNKLGLSTVIAKDALSIFINPENNVKELSVRELEKVFTGDIKNWNALGGDDAEIKLIIRNPNSGTYQYFKEHILGGHEYDSSATIVSTTNSVISKILQDKYAIGYGGIGYNKGQEFINVDGYAPTIQNVINNHYPISRYLYFYTLDTPRGHIKEFIEWTVSLNGQNIVKKSGFIPLVNKSY